MAPTWWAGGLNVVAWRRPRGDWGAHESGTVLFVKKNKADLFAALARVLLTWAKQLLQRNQVSGRAEQLCNPRAFPQFGARFREGSRSRNKYHRMV